MWICDPYFLVFIVICIDTDVRSVYSRRQHPAFLFFTKQCYLAQPILSLWLLLLYPWFHTFEILYELPFLKLEYGNVFLISCVPFISDYANATILMRGCLAVTNSFVCVFFYQLGICRSSCPFCSYNLFHAFIMEETNYFHMLDN